MNTARIARWAALLLTPTLLAAPGPADAGSAASVLQVAPGANAAASDKVCATPALAPSLKIRKKPLRVKPFDASQVRSALRIARAGHRLDIPARGQAIALMAALSGSNLDPDGDRFLFAPPIEGADDDGGMSRVRFYRSLRQVDGWRSLPPGIAAHRAIGDADPYAHDAHWSDAVRLLGALAADPTIDPERAVATGARTKRRCETATPEGVGLPLPAGTSYRVTGTGDDRRAATPARLGKQGIEFRAHCGTQVLASISGTVVIEQAANVEAGPWRVGIRNSRAGVTVWYHHVLSPVVKTGESVHAGRAIAQVGDFGGSDTCSVGIAVWEKQAKGQTGQKKAKGKKGKRGAKADRERPVKSLAWLREHAVPGVPLVAPKKPKRKPIPDTTLRVASFNVLGAHLTGPGGSKSHFAPGAERMRAGIDLLERSDIGIVALNEFEGPQAAEFAADPDWDLHRATGNSGLRGGDFNGNAIAWRSDSWELEQVEQEVVVPWQVTLHMPVVRLRHTETRRQVLVMAIHNPASTKKQGNQQGARDAARGTELDAVRTLRETTGLPIIVMGDMNERDAVFCHFTGSGDLVAAAGGSRGGTCQPPGYGGVDWIFGSPELAFSDFVVDGATRSGISDHALVSSTVLIPGD